MITPQSAYMLNSIKSTGISSKRYIRFLYPFFDVVSSLMLIFSAASIFSASSLFFLSSASSFTIYLITHSSIVKLKRPVL